MLRRLPQLPVKLHVSQVGRLFTIVLFLTAVCTPVRAETSLPDYVQDGVAGFVVSGFRYALAEDAAKTGACPGGMTEGYADRGEVFVDVQSLRQREGETEDEHLRRIFGAAFGDNAVSNYCMNPELGAPDPRFRAVSGEGLRVSGIDIDGVDSRGGAPKPGACPHADFTGKSGEAGIDNQFYRVMGCMAAYQSTGLSNSFDIEMLTGSWGILITVSGIDDIVNDDHVEVGLFANADPIQLSPNREPLPWATYAIHPDQRYQARTTGRIRNGVLTTEPVDVRFEWIVNSIRTDRVLDRARLQVTLDEAGELAGYLAGYTGVEDLYNFKFGYRNGTDGTGNLAPEQLRVGSSIGKAMVLGYTCEGVYHALYEHADADPDPDTGRCTSLSTQYELEAIPAYVVAGATRSQNEALDAAGFGRGGDNYSNDNR